MSKRKKNKREFPYRNKKEFLENVRITPNPKPLLPDSHKDIIIDNEFLDNSRYDVYTNTMGGKVRLTQVNREMLEAAYKKCDWDYSESPPPPPPAHKIGDSHKDINFNGTWRVYPYLQKNRLKMINSETISYFLGILFQGYAYLCAGLIAGLLGAIAAGIVKFSYVITF